MATLKISDLSVGDWVYYDKGNTPYSIRSIYRTGRQDCVVLNDSVFPEGVIGFVGRLTPIPITAEILEKNGFESTTKPNVFTLAHGELQLYVSKELDGWTMSFVNFMERLCILQVIRKSYIHDLQHALRLAGVDKEINL